MGTHARSLRSRMTGRVIPRRAARRCTRASQPPSSTGAARRDHSDTRNALMMSRRTSRPATSAQSVGTSAKRSKLRVLPVGEGSRVLIEEFVTAGTVASVDLISVAELEGGTGTDAVVIDAAAGNAGIP